MQITRLTGDPGHDLVWRVASIRSRRASTAAMSSGFMAGSIMRVAWPNWGGHSTTVPPSRLLATKLTLLAGGKPPPDLFSREVLGDADRAAAKAVALVPELPARAQAVHSAR